MRSLTFKLVLAFLATSVAGTLLASFFVRSSIARGFDDYVIDQRRDLFVAQVSSYYASNGNWQGIERWLREPAPRRRDRATQGGSEPPFRPGGPSPRFMPFVLVDTAGTVVIPVEGRFQPGQNLDESELARGTPVVVDGQVIGTVITLERPPFLNLAEEQYLRRADWALGIAGLVAVAIALSLGFVFARLITQPVRELTAAAGHIASGDLDQRVPVRSRDELGLLAVQFNQMVADLARANALRRQMTADIAHDLRTPLTVIAGYLEALRDETLKPTSERFATLYGEIQLLLRLVEDLHTLSLADAGELALQAQSIEARPLLEQVVDRYRHLADQQGVELVVTTSEPLPTLRGDPEHLARVLGNLVGNALRHTPRGGRVLLDGHAVSSGIQLSVVDTGTGIAPEHLSSIFERSYRVDAARSLDAGGSGLGLAIVRSLVEAHGGVVGVTSTLGQGTTFTITLPCR